MTGAGVLAGEINRGVVPLGKWGIYEKTDNKRGEGY